MSYINELFSLDGKVAIVTGAARGNGKAMAEALLRSGATVYLVDILENVSDVCYEFSSQSLLANFEILDLSCSQSIDKLVKKIILQEEKIDILVNNAGITFGSDILNYPDEMWEATYRINLKAPYELSRLVSKYMIKNGGGSIINITSLNSELAFPDNPAYVTFKGALKQMTKSFALDLGKFNVRCNNIGPGYIKTEMTKGSWEDLDKRESRAQRTAIGRWGVPEDLAGAVVFLSSKASSYITGQDIYIDGGWLIKGI